MTRTGGTFRPAVCLTIMRGVRFTASTAAGLLIAAMALAQVPDGVRSLQLRRDQQQGENALRSEQFRRDALNPPRSPAEARDRAALASDQRLRLQQLNQRQQLDLSVTGPGRGPDAQTRRESELRQFDSDRQRQRQRFEAERTLQDAAHR